MNTLQYYNDNANEYFHNTVNVDMSQVYNKFLKYIIPEAHICDLGCGSGRDTKYFCSKGYTVTPIDGSLEMCRLAENYIGKKVYCLKFEQFNFFEKFDAVWACSSLLHVPYSEMQCIFNKIVDGCKNNAIIYTCFKYGEGPQYNDGRLFSNYTFDTFNSFLSKLTRVKLLEEWLSFDVRGTIENLQWLNLLLRVNK